MNRTLYRWLSCGIALCCAAWIVLAAGFGIAQCVLSWTDTPVGSVFAFTGFLLVGGGGIAIGCTAVQTLPIRPRESTRGFEVLPPRR